MFEARSLALLASALSEDYGVKVTIGGVTPNVGFSSDGKAVINIPALDVQNADYQMLIRGYIDHEAAHVRFTSRPDKGRIVQTSSVTHAIENIYEDIYVERVMGQCFPGCSRNLRRVAEYIYTKGSPDDRVPVYEAIQAYQDGKISTQDYAQAIWSAVLNFILYSVRGQTSDSILPYVSKHRDALEVMVPGLSDALGPVIARVPTEGINTEANRALAVETEQIIRAFINQEEQDGEANEENSGQPNSDGGETGSNNQPSEGANSKGGQSKSSNQNDSDRSGQMGSESGNAMPSNVQSGLSKDLQDAFNEASSSAGKSIQDMAQQVTEAIQNHINQNNETCNMSAYEMNLIAGDSSSMRAYIKELPDQDVHDSERVSAALDAQLQSLLQTFVLNRGGTARIGKLDTNKLHKLATGSDRIFKRRVEKQGVNTEIVIIVDMSGSMLEASKDIITSKSLYALIKSLRKIQGCTSSAIGFSGIDIINILGPEDRLTRKLKLCPSGGTLCGEALMHGMRLFSSNLESRKIIIMMTDGETGNQDYFAHVIQSAKRSGIEVVGIGIRDTAIKNYLSSNECCIINNLNQMTSELFRILRHKLLGRVA